MVTCGSEEPPPQLTPSAVRGTSPCQILPTDEGRSVEIGRRRIDTQRFLGAIREKRLKHWPPEWKLNLIDEQNLKWTYLYETIV